MLIIGERINSSRKIIALAIQEKDESVLCMEAENQVNAGANFLDINCGTLSEDEEPEVLAWMVQLIQSKLNNIPICIDSPNPKALDKALSVHKGKAIINSISAESRRFNEVLPLIKQYNSSVIALCLDDQGIHRNLEDSLSVGERLVCSLLDTGIDPEDIYFDPLVRSIATSSRSAIDLLQLMELMMKTSKGIHFVSGLSNVSFGLPERRHINRAYAVLCAAKGMDAFILDPLDNILMNQLYASQALVNKDRYCMRYINIISGGRHP